MDGSFGADLHEKISKLKAAHLREGFPSAETRIAWLDKAIALLVDHSDAICAAISEDFGHRSKDQSLLGDIVTSITALKYSKKYVRKWMKPEKRSPEFPLGLLGARAELQFQPKGVVGVISPWNFPVSMVFVPLAGIFAAGNRAMIKPSEFTPRTSDMMKKLIGEYFDDDEATVVTGEGDVGAAFTQLPFDHIIFTGSTGVARHVMRAAADNLVPVTLELGGKSPAIFSESADYEKSAQRLMNGKALNAGQICTAPDYVLVPVSKKTELVENIKKAVATMYGAGIKDNDDYTSIINQRHYDRLKGLLEDARDKGADVIELNPQGEDFSQQQHLKMPPYLILDPSDDMAVMREEIFGPILPVKGYNGVDEAIDFINDGPRPLALYYFGDDNAERDRILSRTTVGGVTVNDTLMHVAQEDLPFGGVGASGMGAYHGRDGFLEFSHKKSVLHQTGSELISFLRPPYGDFYRKQMNAKVKA
ncbi:MAG: coniferyl aldehyde dehydrogenase [Pseudomonadota bacterium]